MYSVKYRSAQIILLSSLMLAVGCSNEARVLYMQTPDVREEYAVEFVIDDYLNNEQIKPTIEKIREMMGTNMCAVVKMNTPERTFISITPIDDVEAFIGSIEFARVEQIESRKYRLHLLD